MFIVIPITETKFKLRSPLRNRVPMTSASDYGAQRSCPKGLRASGPTGLETIYQVPTRPTLLFLFFLIASLSGLASLQIEVINK